MILLQDEDLTSLKMILDELGSIPAEYYNLAENADRKPLLILLGRALTCEKQQEFSKALDMILNLFDQCPVLPNRVVGLAAHCANKVGRPHDLLPILLEFASHAEKENKLSLTMNVVKQLFSYCGGGQNYWMFKNPDSMLFLSSILQNIANKTSKIKAIPRQNKKPRYAMVTVNLVDHILAYSKTAMQFSRYLDSEKYDCYLYFTEETWEEKPQEFSIKFTQMSSLQTAPEFMAELEQSSTKVRVCPPVNAHESALWLAKQMQEDKIDGVIFQAGVNAAVQWVASAICDVPVKTSLCLGLNMYQPGQHATIYMNEINLEREKAFWNKAWGKQFFISGGADRGEAKETPPLERSTFNIDESQVTFGTLTNYIDDRITTEYLACVSKVLRECENSIFICMGQGDTTEAIKFMQEQNLADRCRWLPRQKSAFAALKLLDFYFNEFPIGGSQSIRECIACDVPAMSLEYSPNHHESVGADIVGEEAVLNCDKDAYAQKAIDWIKNKELREAAKERLSKRSKELYSAEIFVQKLANLLAELS